MHRIIDSTAPLDFIAKNGYYQIGNAIAVHMGPALQEASRTGLPVHWNFHEQVYNNFDWRSRLNLPVTELYRLRAQQLRERYDYLILWFSGGADSTIILQSFIDNGIKLDEVMIAWPRQQSSGKYVPNLNTASENFISEWDFSIQPKLNWLAQHHPEIKITVLEQFSDLNTVEDFEDTWTIAEKHNYASIVRQRLADRELQQRYKKHKNIASIAGCAPPEICILDNRWIGLQFNNAYASAGNGKSDYLLDGTPRNVEYFYWTPDFPELIREQAHIILEHLNSNPQDRSLFLHFEIENRKTLPSTRELAELRRNLIKKIIYPQWDQSTFQVVKPTDHYGRPSQYDWFFSNPESKIYTQSWESAIRSQHALINSQWIKKDKHGIVEFPTFLSKIYPIGRLRSMH